jgi:hypothetical protein
MMSSDKPPTTATQPSREFTLFGRFFALTLELGLLHRDAKLLAAFVMGITPDQNTQTETEIEATVGEVHAAARRVLAKQR